MQTLPRKKTVQYPEQTNTKVSEDIFKDLELLDQAGVDVGELKREAITEAVKKAMKIINKSCG